MRGAVVGEGFRGDGGRGCDPSRFMMQVQAPTPRFRHRWAHFMSVNDRVIQLLVCGGYCSLVGVISGIRVVRQRGHDGRRVERIMKRFPSGDSTENPAPRPSTVSRVMSEPRMY